MQTAVSGRRGGVYLRVDGLDRLFEPLNVPRLNRFQQAAILGVGDTSLWRIATRGNPVGGQLIADLLTSARTLADRWGTQPPAFEDLFEVRPAA